MALRYHGVFAPASPDRSRVVPRTRLAAASPANKCGEASAADRQRSMTWAQRRAPWPRRRVRRSGTSEPGAAPGRPVVLSAAPPFRRPRRRAETGKSWLAAGRTGISGAKGKIDWPDRWAAAASICLHPPGPTDSAAHIRPLIRTIRLAAVFALCSRSSKTISPFLTPPPPASP